MKRFRPSGLWRDPAFLKLWMGQAISQIGSQVSFLALPLLAVVVLKATPVQMGLLTATGAIPSLLFGVHAGAMVDRRARLPLMIAADVARALVLALIPLLWSMGILTMALLYPIAILVGAMGLIFDIAYQALLPTLVGRDRLVEANSKLELSRTAAEIAGPGLAGGLVALLTAPFAIAADALSFAISGLFLWRIRRQVDDRPTSTVSGSVGRAAITGIRLAFNDARLRTLIGSRAALNFFNATLEAVFVLYIVRSLGVSAALLGFAFSIGSVGFLLGALLPQRLERRIGIGRTIACGTVVVALSDLLIPLVRGNLVTVTAVLIVAQFCFGLGLTVFNVGQASLRQALVPDAFLGRVGATARMLNATVVPLGALAGGALGQAVGLRETLLLAACGELLAAVWLWWSPVRRIASLSDAAPALRVPIDDQQTRECRRGKGGNMTRRWSWMPLLTALRRATPISPCS